MAVPEWKESTGMTASVGKAIAAVGDGIAAFGNRLAGRQNTAGAFPPGHYYSPIPDRQEVFGERGEVFAKMSNRDLRPWELPGVDLNDATQLANLQTLSKHYPQFDFPATKADSHRYHIENSYFAYSDGIFLFGTLLEFRPKNVVEIGSGFSSLLMLDVKERHLNDINLTFIDPDDHRLRAGMRPGDAENATITTKKIQDVDTIVFDCLDDGDILFIDSSHVSKTGSDVNWLMFEVVPRLKPGVLVHIHDIGYPFEYCTEWLELGWFWNEAYLVRSFLQFNETFEVYAWGQYLVKYHSEMVGKAMPDCLKDQGGSLWLRRTK